MPRGIEYAVDLLPAGIGYLVYGFGYLDLGEDHAVLLHGRDLVDSSEYGVALGGYEPLPHAERVYASPLVEDGCDGVLVEAVGGDDPAVFETGLVEPPSYDLREVCQVSRVEADPLESLPHRFEDFLRAAYGVGGAGPQHVVGVDEEHSVVGIYAGVALERFEFRIVVHDPAVGHGSADRDAEHLPREHGGRSDSASDVRSPRTVDGGVHVVCSAGAEVRDRAPSGRPDDAGCFSGYEGLVVELCENRGFDHLGIDERCRDRDDGLAREYDRAFVEGPYVAAESVSSQEFEESIVEHME